MRSFNDSNKSPSQNKHRRLDLNEMDQLDPLSLQGLASLRHLRLDVNRLTAVPQKALAHLKQLEILWDAHDNILSNSHFIFLIDFKRKSPRVDLVAFFYLSYFKN